MNKEQGNKKEDRYAFDWYVKESDKNHLNIARSEMKEKNRRTTELVLKCMAALLFVDVISFLLLRKSQ